ncbi:MAG: cobalt-precorrin-5B (C(1))-methyltransferase CbiD [Oscillospiraceae bacterium]|nr:cobalt-precorrin-5B (C(1))-methyltransferase CbiD [Oscillospiraceae bacterium]
MATLRTGVTTGTCAAAAAKAATVALLSLKFPEIVEIVVKNGESIKLEVIDSIQKENESICAVIKDAGDDPDVTNGVKVFATVWKTDEKSIEVDGGEGIGRVTKPGLKVQVGYAAINPVPMEMIKTAISEVCSLYSYEGGIKAVISIPGGEEIAKKTMNARLGIIGGLSILGTSGIVEPMSEKALIDTIKADIDVNLASGVEKLIVTPGNYGRDFAQNELGLDIEEAVKCSNYVGETLDYLATKSVDRIMFIGHAGKLVKLAGGIMNTHSAIADCRMEILASHSALAGANADTISRIMDCVSTQGAIEIIEELGIGEAVWKTMGEKIGFYLRERIKGSYIIEYIVFTQENGILIRGETQ